MSTWAPLAVGPVPVYEKAPPEVVVVLPVYPASTVILTCNPDSPLPLVSFRYPLTVTVPAAPVTCVIVTVVPVRVEVVAVVDELVLAVTVTVLVLVVYSIVVRTPETTVVRVDQM